MVSLDERKSIIKGQNKAVQYSKTEDKITDIFVGVFMVVVGILGFSIILFLILTNEITLKYRQSFNEKDAISEGGSVDKVKDPRVLQIDGKEYELEFKDKLPSSELQLLKMSDNSILTRDLNSFQTRKYNLYDIYYYNSNILGQIVEISEDYVIVNLFNSPIALDNNFFTQTNTTFQNIPKVSGSIFTAKINEQISGSNLVLKSIESNNTIQFSHKLNPAKSVYLSQFDLINSGQVSIGRILNINNETKEVTYDKFSSSIAVNYQDRKVVRTKSNIRIEGASVQTGLIQPNGKVEIQYINEKKSFLPFEDIVFGRVLFGKILDVEIEEQVVYATLELLNEPIEFVSADVTKRQVSSNEKINNTPIELIAFDIQNNSVWVQDEANIFEVKVGQVIIFESRNIAILSSISPVNSKYTAEFQFL